MKSIGICLEGIEDVVAEDLKGKKVASKRILFDYNPEKEPKSIDLVFELVEKFKFKDEEDIFLKVANLNLKIDGSFRVVCKREGDNKLVAREVERRVGEILYQKGFKVNLKNPKNIIYVDITDDLCFIGYLIKDEVCKRDYRIKIHNQSISACLAYCLIKLSGWDKGVLVDPFCKDGVICIEAAGYGKGEIYGFDELNNNVRNARINGSFAEAKVTWDCYELALLNARFKEIDFIVSNVPFESKRRSEKEVRKCIKELFYQAKNLLRKRMVLVSRKDEIIKEEGKGFKLVKEIKVMQGQEGWFVLVFEP